MDTKDNKDGIDTGGEIVKKGDLGFTNHQVQVTKTIEDTLEGAGMKQYSYTFHDEEETVVTLNEMCKLLSPLTEKQVDHLTSLSTRKMIWFYKYRENKILTKEYQIEMLQRFCFNNVGVPKDDKVIMESIEHLLTTDNQLKTIKKWLNTFDQVCKDANCDIADSIQTHNVDAFWELCTHKARARSRRGRFNDKERDIEGETNKYFEKKIRGLKSKQSIEEFLNLFALLYLDKNNQFALNGHMMNMHELFEGAESKQKTYGSENFDKFVRFVLKHNNSLGILFNEGPDSFSFRHIVDYVGADYMAQRIDIKGDKSVYQYSKIRHSENDIHDKLNKESFLQKWLIDIQWDKENEFTNGNNNGRKHINLERYTDPNAFTKLKFRKKLEYNQYQECTNKMNYRQAYKLLMEVDPQKYSNDKYPTGIKDMGTLDEPTINALLSKLNKEQIQSIYQKRESTRNLYKKVIEENFKNKGDYQELNAVEISSSDDSQLQVVEYLLSHKLNEIQTEKCLKALSNPSKIWANPMLFHFLNKIKIINKMAKDRFISSDVPEKIINILIQYQINECMASKNKKQDNNHKELIQKQKESGYKLTDEQTTTLINSISNFEPPFHIHKELIQEQDKYGYSLTDEQINTLVNTMGNATSDFHIHKELIQEQKKYGYSLTDEQINTLVNAMDKATSHFHIHKELIQEQDKYGYSLTKKNLEILYASLLRARHNEKHSIADLLEHDGEGYNIPTNRKKIGKNLFKSY